MYKSVKEIQELIEASKSRKYMKIVDSLIDAATKKSVDSSFSEKCRESVNKSLNNPEVIKNRKKANQKAAETRKNDPNFGKKISELNKKRAKDKNSEWSINQRIGARNRAYEPVSSPQGIFDSQIEWREKTGSKFPFSHKMVTHPHLYYKVKDGPKAPIMDKTYYSPYVVSNSPKQFRKFLQDLGIKDADKFARFDKWFNYMCSNYDGYEIKIEPRRDFDDKLKNAWVKSLDS